MNGRNRTSESGKAAGLVAGSKVATSLGWRPVEAVVPGDRVLTFDSGMQEVTHVSRGILWSEETEDDEPCPRHLWPLAVPAGALGNAQAMLLLPEQSVIIESDVAEEIYGDPYTLIPARGLEGFRGIERVEPGDGMGVIMLHFSRDQVIFGSAGALFHCPSVRSLSVAELVDESQADYVVLGVEDAAFLLGCIEIDAQQGVEPDLIPADEPAPAGEPATAKTSSQAAVEAV